MQDPRVRQAVRNEDARLTAQGTTSRPIAFYDGKEAFILTPMVKDVAGVQRAIFHEVLGHHGLRKTFGKELGAILDQIALMRTKDVVQKAADYKFDLSDKSDIKKAAEEVLAEMAETHPELGFVQRAIAAIRKWLRANGFNLKLTDNDIIANYILPAREYVKNGFNKQDSSSLPTELTALLLPNHFLNSGVLV